MSLFTPVVIERFRTLSGSVYQVESGFAGTRALTKVLDLEAPPASASRLMVCGLDDYPCATPGARFVGRYDGHQVISTSPVVEILPTDYDPDTYGSDAGPWCS